MLSRVNIQCSLIHSKRTSFPHPCETSPYFPMGHSRQSPPFAPSNGVVYERVDYFPGAAEHGSKQYSDVPFSMAIALSTCSATASVATMLDLRTDPAQGQIHQRPGLSRLPQRRHGQPSAGMHHDSVPAGQNQAPALSGRCLNNSPRASRGK
jgi:hypothetical protein